MDRALVRDGERFREMDLVEALESARPRLKDIAIVLGGDCTQEEAMAWVEVAMRNHLSIGTTAKEGISTAGMLDLVRARRIDVRLDVERFPVLKVFIREAMRNGAVLTDGVPDLVIKEAPGQGEDVPTMIMHEGVNDTGLLRLGLKGVPVSKNYLHVGNLRGRLPGFTIVLGFCEDADIMLPNKCFAEKEGTVINSAGRELRFKRARVNDLDMMGRLFPG
jgi:hypothetical protein